MRRYNYFDDDDVVEQRRTRSSDVSKKAKRTRESSDKKRAAGTAQEHAAASYGRRVMPPSDFDAVLKPPKPSIGTDHLDDIHGVTDIAQYEKPAVMEVTVPSLDSAAVTARKEPEPVAVHPITVAEVTIPELRDDGDEVSDAIRAFSHKSGDKVTIARIKRVAETVIESNPIEVIERVSRGKKFIITVVLSIFTVLFFVGLVFFFMHSINAENDRIGEFNADAGEVCADYVMRYGSANYENLYNTYGVQGFRLTGLCFVREVDFDNDGSSELVLSYLNNGEYYNDVWGYNSSGDFDVLFSEKAAQSEDKSQDAWTTLYYRNNKYMIAVHDPEDITQVTMYQLRNNKFSESFSCTFDEVSAAYVVNDKQDLTSFERIKLAVLRAEKAIVSADAVMNTLDDFAGTESVVADPGTAQSLEKSYYAIVQEYNKRYGTAKYTDSNGIACVEGLAVVDLVDFDGDGQDELLLVYRKEIKVREENNSGKSITKTTEKYYCDIYRYSGTRALLAYTNEGLSNSAEKADDVYYILKKEGDAYHYCINSANTKNYGNELNASFSEMAFNGTEFSSSQNLSYAQEYGYSEYSVEGESVKKSVFEDTAEGIPLFYENGENYNKAVYSVTYLQRKSSEAGDLNQIPANTEKAIKKLNAQYEAT